MRHIGIDLGSRKSHICVRDETSQIVAERVVRTEELGAWLSEQDPGFVVMETCSESFAVADLASEAGHTVRVVPAGVVRQLGVGHRGVKNDVRDARVLSRGSVALGQELPTVHVPSAHARHINKLLSQRGTLVRSRTALVNAVKGQLRSKLLRLGSGTTQTLPRRTREMLAGTDEALLAMLEPMLEALEALEKSIRALEAQLAEATKEEPRIARLRKVPGVGALTAAAFVATLDTAERFDCAARVGSYLGLTPREDTTGGNRKLLGITKAGRAQLRTLLIQASWTLVRVAPSSPLAEHFAKLVKSKPKQVAIAAVARRLAGILFAMLRDGSVFDPNHTRNTSRPRPKLPAKVLAA